MDAVSSRQWSRPRRSWLLAAAVGAPLLVAIPATVLVWSGANHTALPQTAATAPALPLFDRPANATIFYVIDSSETQTTSGSVLEFLLNTAPGQSATSSQPTVLQAIPEPPCHVQPICHLAGVSEFAFQARAPGTALLTFRLGACASPPCASTVVVKPVVVGIPPQVRSGSPVR